MANRTHDFILGNWTPHQGDGIPQYDAVDGSIVATAGNEPLDYERILAFGREVGGSALRIVTTPARCRMLKA